MLNTIPADQILEGDLIRCHGSPYRVETITKADRAPFFIRFYLARTSAEQERMGEVEYMPHDLVTIERPHPHAIMTALAIVYPRPYDRAHDRRSAALQAHFGPDAKDDPLPRNEGEVLWEYNGHYFRLLPFNRDPGENRRHQGRARFQLWCPICRKWYSVGKFMLHAAVHTEE